MGSANGTDMERTGDLPLSVFLYIANPYKLASNSESLAPLALFNLPLVGFYVSQDPAGLLFPSSF